MCPWHFLQVAGLTVVSFPFTLFWTTATKNHLSDGKHCVPLCIWNWRVCGGHLVSGRPSSRATRWLKRKLRRWRRPSRPRSSPAPSMSHARGPWCTPLHRPPSRKTTVHLQTPLSFPLDSFSFLLCFSPIILSLFLPLSVFSSSVYFSSLSRSFLFLPLTFISQFPPSFSYSTLCPSKPFSVLSFSWIFSSLFTFICLSLFSPSLFSSVIPSHGGLWASCHFCSAQSAPQWALITHTHLQYGTRADIRLQNGELDPVLNYVLYTSDENSCKSPVYTPKSYKH